MHVLMHMLYTPFALILCALFGSICPILPTQAFALSPSCASLFRVYNTSLHPPRVAASAPPRDVPPSMRSEYLASGARLESYYVDDSNRSAGYHFRFKTDAVLNMMRDAALAFQPRSPQFARLRETDRWLHAAIAEFGCVQSNEENQILVVGSMQPWHESMLVGLCPRARTHSMDYNRLSYAHERMRTDTVVEWTRALLDESSRQDTLHAPYDSALAILSIEHDGLGRYGDPIDADADLATMRRLRCVLKPGGLLFLAVAVGRDDVLAWNLRRVYGCDHSFFESFFIFDCAISEEQIVLCTISASSPWRLPQLLAGWRERARFGWDSSRVARHSDFRSTYAPVFVLERIDADHVETAATIGDASAQPRQRTEL